MTETMQKTVQIDEFFGHMVNLVPASMFLERTEEEEDELQNAKYYRVRSHYVYGLNFIVCLCNTPLMLPLNLFFVSP